MGRRPYNRRVCVVNDARTKALAIPEGEKKIRVLRVNGDVTMTEPYLKPVAKTCRIIFLDVGSSPDSLPMQPEARIAVSRQINSASDDKRIPKQVQRHNGKNIKSDFYK